MLKMFRFNGKIFETARAAFGRATGAFRVAAIAAAIAACSAAHGQTAGKPVDEQTLTINRITYKIEGPKTISEDAITAHVRLRKGMKFDQKSLDQSIRSTKRGFTTSLTQRARRLQTAEWTSNF